ncbi:hypothetical protein DFH06DRAFT_1378711 [Mycena polygramma]|nr:hypothetical protein DFH06DRAFT_1378711 [Mycena polygramma]
MASGGKPEAVRIKRAQRKLSLCAVPKDSILPVHPLRLGYTKTELVPIESYFHGGPFWPHAKRWKSRRGQPPSRLFPLYPHHLPLRLESSSPTSSSSLASVELRRIRNHLLDPSLASPLHTLIIRLRDGRFSSASGASLLAVYETSLPPNSSLAAFTHHHCHHHNFVPPSSPLNLVAVACRLAIVVVAHLAKAPARRPVFKTSVGY